MMGKNVHALVSPFCRKTVAFSSFLTIIQFLMANKIGFILFSTIGMKELSLLVFENKTSFNPMCWDFNSHFLFFPFFPDWISHELCQQCLHPKPKLIVTRCLLANFFPWEITVAVTTQNTVVYIDQSQWFAITRR